MGLYAPSASLSILDGIRRAPSYFVSAVDNIPRLSSEFLLALLYMSSDICGEITVSNQNQWLDPEGGTLAVNYCLVVLCPVPF